VSNGEVGLRYGNLLCKFEPYVFVREQVRSRCDASGVSGLEGCQCTDPSDMTQLTRRTPRHP